MRRRSYATLLPWRLRQLQSAGLPTSRDDCEIAAQSLESLKSKTGCGGIGFFRIQALVIGGFAFERAVTAYS
jgi:hypothetical protein